DWHHTTLEPDGIFILSVESGNTPDTKEELNWNGDIPWLAPREITKPRHTLYLSKTEKYITNEALKKGGVKLMPPQTVMLTKRAPVGAVAINKIPMSTNQGFLNFICGPKLRPAYLAYWLKGNKKYLDKVANGSTYPELYRSDLFEFKIAIPSLEQQDMIINALDSFAKLKILNLLLEESEVNKDTEEVNLTSKLESELLIALLSGEIEIV
ncbi:restriction endonuclease subunit S, partial [Candidatus Nomurabacteria bacterium]|nr:restriction endonuclease subunit S [Candidatus Nomurabacteria bacterium]